MAESGQWHNIALNNFFLQVLEHALIKFLIDVFIDFINYGIHFLIRTSFQLKHDNK